MLWRRGEGVEPSGNNISRQAGFEDRWGHRAPSSSSPSFTKDLTRFAQPADRPECPLTARNFRFRLERENISRYRVPRREKGRTRRSLRTLLFVELVEQGLGVFQVGGIEAFGEPVVDFGQHRARFIEMTLLREQAREAGRGAQFK